MRRTLLVTLAAIALAASLAAGQPLPGTLAYSRLTVDAALTPRGAEFTLRGVLVNNMGEPAVPGYGYIVLSAVAPEKLLGILPVGGAKRVPVRIGHVRVLVDGKPVDYRVEYVNGTAVLKYSVWRPIPPGGKVSVEVSFETEGVAADGPLFRHYSLRLGFPHESVGEAVVRVSAKGGWLCYTSLPGGAATFRGLGPGSTLGFEAEVSKYVPLPLLPFPGSLLLWGAVAAAGVALLLYKRARRV